MQAVTPPADERAGPAHLLVVSHSRSGSTGRLRDAFLAGAETGGGDEVEIRSLSCFDAGPDDVLWADALALGTPANFGYMSGALKDFLERIYHACLGQTAGRPYVVFVKGDTDADGAVTSVSRIVAGLQWKAVLPPFAVVGPIEGHHLSEVEELGATLAAGLAAGIF